MSSFIPPGCIDSHVHFWDPQLLEYPWLRTASTIAKPHLPADYARAHRSLPITRWILVEAGCTTPERELDWFESLAGNESGIAAIVAQVSLDRGDETRKRIRELAQRPLVRGVRHILQGESDPYFCLRPEFTHGIRWLGDTGLSLDLCVRSDQIAVVAQMVAQCPDVSFILDHLGKPQVRDGQLEPWKEDLSRLAEHPRVACKVSGLLTEASTNWTPDQLAPYLHHVIHTFGAERLLFGSDWPVCELAGSLSQWIDILRQFFPQPSQRDLFFLENVKKWYRIE